MKKASQPVDKSLVKPEPPPTAPPVGEPPVVFRDAEFARRIQRLLDTGMIVIRERHIVDRRIPGIVEPDKSWPRR